MKPNACKKTNVDRMNLLPNTDDYSTIIFIGDMVLLNWLKILDNDMSRERWEHTPECLDDMSFEVIDIEFFNGDWYYLIEKPTDKDHWWFREDLLHKIYGGT